MPEIKNTRCQAIDEFRKVVIYVEAIRSHLPKDYPTGEQLLAYGVWDLASAAYTLTEESGDILPESDFEDSEQGLGNFMWNLRRNYKLSVEFSGDEFQMLEKGVRNLPDTPDEENTEIFRVYVAQYSQFGLKEKQ